MFRTGLVRSDAWLNGEKVCEAVGTFQPRRACVAEQRGIRVRLRAGRNRLLIKTSNIEHEWWVRVRLTELSGRPVEVSRS